MKEGKVVKAREKEGRYKGRQRDLESSLASVDHIPSSKMGSRSQSIASCGSIAYPADAVELIGWSY